jgi:RNA polymerase sigma factor (sigma-70 family)
MRPIVHGTAPPAYDLDMTALDDGPLVVLAQECGYRPARDELICRHLGLARQFVGHYACRHRLQEVDADDAEQDAVLWVLEAIRRYRTDESVKAGGCHFRSFLHRVIASRLVDFSRRLQLRNHAPLDAVGAACTSRPRYGQGPSPPECLEEEVRAGLDQELARLGEADRGLWDLMAAGTPLRRAAATLGLSYDTAKRRRRKLLAHLKCSLNGGCATRPLT